MVGAGIMGGVRWGVDIVSTSGAGGGLEVEGSNGWRHVHVE
jgi:hypothetical protein